MEEERELIKSRSTEHYLKDEVRQFEKFRELKKNSARYGPLYVSPRFTRWPYYQNTENDQKDPERRYALMPNFRFAALMFTNFTKSAAQRVTLLPQIERLKYSVLATRLCLNQKNYPEWNRRHMESISSLHRVLGDSLKFDSFELNPDSSDYNSGGPIKFAGLTSTFLLMSWAAKDPALAALIPRGQEHFLINDYENPEQDVKASCHDARQLGLGPEIPFANPAGLKEYLGHAKQADLNFIEEVQNRIQPPQYRETYKHMPRGGGNLTEAEQEILLSYLRSLRD